MSCAAIIVASGSSRRMGFDKLAAELNGRSVLRASVEAFIASPSISHVVVVCSQDRFDSLLQASFDKPVSRVDGGAERQDSVANGLAALAEADSLVAVHDGARPLVSPDDIDLCVQAAATTGAASLARPISETIKRADNEGFSTGGVDRQNLWHTETPQIFKRDLLEQAYQSVRSENLTVTDEVSALESIGIPTKLIASTAPNLKITHPGDIELAEALTR